MIAVFNLIIVIMAVVMMPHSLAPPLPHVSTTSNVDTAILSVITAVANVNIAVVSIIIIFMLTCIHHCCSRNSLRILTFKGGT